MQLLQFVELGGYGNFDPLFSELGYQVTTFTSARKMVAHIRRHPPAAIVGEFNYLPEFRDRLSQMESIIAAVAHHNAVRVVLFYYDYDSDKLQILQQRFSAIKALPRPVDSAALRLLLTP